MKKISVWLFIPKTLTIMYTILLFVRWPAHKITGNEFIFTGYAQYKFSAMASDLARYEQNKLYFNSTTFYRTNKSPQIYNMQACTPLIDLLRAAVEIGFSSFFFQSIPLRQGVFHP